MHLRCLNRRTHETPRRMMIRGQGAPLGTRRLKAVVEGQGIAEAAPSSPSGPADRRNASTDRREAVLTQREEAVGQREKAVHASMRRARIRAELKALEAVHAREANEQLVLMAVDGQARLEEAELQTLHMCYLAEHDALTELPNRTLFAERLKTAMAQAVDAGARLALMYLDIDHFKGINDAHGHRVGDLVLQSVAREIQACIRSTDTVCRQGGDEFLVLLPRLEEVEDCAIIARKLKQAMARPQIVGDRRIRVTLSIGICLYPDHASDCESLLGNADAALYEAKEAGRNTFRVFAPGVDR